MELLGVAVNPAAPAVARPANANANANANAPPPNAAAAAAQNPPDGGVWSPAVEQSLRDALLLYPPRGRRKFVVMEEGRMYGRNQMIERHIRLRTGQVRTRKQVSSHMQVLARRRIQEVTRSNMNHAAKQMHLQRMSRQTSSQVVYDGLRAAPGGQAPAPAAANQNVGLFMGGGVGYW